MNNSDEPNKVIVVDLQIPFFFHRHPDGKMGFGFDSRHHHFGNDLQYRDGFHGGNDGRHDASDLKHHFVFIHHAKNSYLTPYH
ncbi:MAG: hypothetical protein NTX45_04940 [Proteobacteria bacterium]|nr:hypothetical protein [Pseudomonadota bacterium]